MFPVFKASSNLQSEGRRRDWIHSRSISRGSFFQGKTAVVGGRWGNRVQPSKH